MKILLQGKIFKHPALWWTFLIQTCTKIPISFVPLHELCNGASCFLQLEICMSVLILEMMYCTRHDFVYLIVSHYLNASQYVAIYSIWPMYGLPGLECALSQVPGMLPAMGKLVDSVYFSRKLFKEDTNNWPWVSLCFVFV